MFKKVIIILCIFLWDQNKNFGQENLVLNGSFEDIISCPEDGGQIHRARYWKSNSLFGTPDLFHYCSPNDALSIPYQYAQNYQWPKTGNAYSGIFPYFSGIIPNQGTEYISGSLTGKLKIDQKYYIQFFISPRISNDPARTPCYMEGLGLALSKIDSIYTLSKSETIPLIPNIKHNGVIIKDTVNWIKVSGCVMGNGEKYICIGNFNSNEQTLVDPLCHTSFPNSAYYYIDDVGIYEFDPLPDTIYLCSGEIKNIGSSFLDGTYLWSTGEKDSVISIEQTGKYIVNIQLENCTLSDTTVVLNPEEEIENQANHFLLCTNESKILDAPLKGEFQWSNGAKTKSIEVIEAGEYLCQITNECGVFIKNYWISKQECDCYFYAPNIISLNSDHVNDDFKLTSNCNLPIRVLSFSVYNRWGELFCRSVDLESSNVKWESLIQNRKIQSGVYLWHVVYEFKNESTVIQKSQSGDVTVIY